MRKVALVILGLVVLTTYACCRVAGECERSVR